MTADTKPVRRTQAERKSATVALLIDATIETISEIGYARASLGEICARSGISRGGLFRHFDSRLDLMATAAREVGRRHLEEMSRQLAGMNEPSVLEVLRLFRARDRATENVVWFELIVAARTDDDLRAAIAPVAKEFVDQTVRAARAHPLMSKLAAPDVTMITTTLEHVFDGETIRRQVVPDPELEDQRLELLADFVGFIAQRSAAAATG